MTKKDKDDLYAAVVVWVGPVFRPLEIESHTLIAKKMGLKHPEPGQDNSEFLWQYVVTHLGEPINLVDHLTSLVAQGLSAFVL